MNRQMVDELAVTFDTELASIVDTRAVCEDGHVSSTVV
jgi:hypothetical protein